MMINNKESYEGSASLARRTLLKQAMAGIGLAAAFPSLLKIKLSSDFSFTVLSSDFDEVGALSNLFYFPL